MACLKHGLLILVLILFQIAGQSQVFGTNKTITPYPNEVSEFLLEDFNNDGYADIVACSKQLNKITYLEYVPGTGHRIEEVLEISISEPEKLRAFHLDGDGILDMSIYSEMDSTIYLLSNDGEGSFTLLDSLFYAGMKYYDFGRINDDELEDLIVVREIMGNNELVYIENVENGGFATELVIDSESIPGSVRVTDRNSDGFDDISFVDYGVNEDDYYSYYDNWHVSMLNIFPGDWIKDTLLYTSHSDYYYNHFMHADLDLDGYEDLLLIESSWDWGATETLSWYKGFETSYEFQNEIWNHPNIDGNPKVVADFDFDGDNDIIVRDGGNARILENNGLEFSLVSNVFINVPLSLKSRDMDQNNYPDLVYVMGTHKPIVSTQFFENYTTETDPFVGTSTTTPSSIQPIDMDGDGLPEILEASKGEHAIHAYKKLNEDKIWAKTDLATGLTNVDFVAAYDVNGDGLEDILTNGAFGDQIIWIPFFGIDSIGNQIVISDFENDVDDIIGVDIDNDEDIDILACSHGNDELFWFRNEGNNTFTNKISLDIEANGITDIEVGDVDTDGDLDILAVMRYDDQVVSYKNLGQGSFSKQIVNPDYNAAQTVEFADLDQDGDLDIVSGSQLEDRVDWYSNDGTGVFGSGILITADADNISDLSVSDFDLDGDMDIACTLFYGEEVFWLENTGDQVFQKIPLLDNVYTAKDVLVADMNGDELDDIVYCVLLEHTIGWIPNIASLPGCTDSLACNFNPAAIIHDGTCCFEDCGCTDPLAENYDENAICDNGSCLYLTGCTNPLATNYNPDATLNDNSCIFIYGCTDPVSLNYDPDAVIYDGSCEYLLSENPNSDFESVDQEVAIAPILKKYGLSLAPNPMDDSATLDLGRLNPLDCLVRIYNQQGSMLREYVNVKKKVVINKEDLSGGLYSIQVSSPAFTTTLKLVVE